MEDKTRILLVEDDANLSMVLKDYLEMLGYETVLRNDGEEGLEAFKENEFSLCILDVMMPKKDGFRLAKDIRAINADIPLIFLTAKSLKEDRIAGFKAGCDDYITKPFSTEELSLRIGAILKRSEIQYRQKKIPDIFELGTIQFDHKNMILIHGGKDYSLTRKEAALLKLLAENKNQLVEREYALEKIWGSSDYFIGRSMDVFIAKLRKMLKIDPNITITNVHGTGFKLEVSDN
ncbi:response regulator transcription factor [Lentimicrobium sp. L6]|uniref:response regulator transcription factor n=1 Tax=Lentimicrobium sp. L6 TaxID=2735916 RepID=UPI001556DEA4|nr:response regulator transcription factor [Lentimicrobium sp. L6]NPD84302.1 response regulator transcription factor [Lentimicrobium sp. L6]